MEIDKIVFVEVYKYMNNYTVLKKLNFILYK